MAAAAAILAGRERRFLEDHMGVRAPHTERAHTSPARGAIALPGREFCVHVERAVGEVDVRIRRAEVNRRWQLFMDHGLGHVDQTGNARGDVQVADIHLGCAEGAKAVGLCASPKCAGQGGEFDGIAERSGGAVSLDVCDRLWIDPSDGVGHGDDVCLTLDAGRRVTHLRGAVVVDCKPLDNRVHVVPFGQSIFEPLQEYDGRSAAEDRALGLGVKRSAVPVPRPHSPLLIEVPALLGKRDRDPPGQGHVALEAEQALAGLTHGHQRRGASALDREARPLQVKLVGDPRGQEVVIRPEQGRIMTHLVCARIFFDERWVGTKAAQEIGVGATAGIDRDRSRVGMRVVTCVFQGFPATFEENPLLGIDELGLPGQDTEEVRVEAVGVVDRGTRPHIIRIIGPRGCIRDLELSGREVRNAIEPVTDVPPELGDVASAREAPGHPNNGDAESGFIRLDFHSSRVRLVIAFWLANRLPSVFLPAPVPA